MEIEIRRCPKCQLEKNISCFYNRRNKKGNSVYCKPCTTVQTVNRQRELKIKAVNYKGGKCSYCKYDKYIGALEFHHKNSLEKDFTISKLKAYTFNKRIITELDKCILLCSNCHKEEHARQRKLI